MFDAPIIDAHPRIIGTLHAPLKHVWSRLMEEKRARVRSRRRQRYCVGMGGAKHSISPEGWAKAEAELQHLREVRRPKIVAEIKVAREFGDLSDNAEYHAAREAQGLNEARIRVLEHHLAMAKVQEGASGDLIGVGSRVSYRDRGNGRVTEVTLVHRLEATVAEGKVSVESQVAKALLGARAGQQVTLDTPRGVKQLEILDVG